MSDADSTDFPSVYPRMAVNREALIDTINALQVDFTMLADWLARDPHPAMWPRAVLALAHMKYDLEAHHPSLRRH